MCKSCRSVGGPSHHHLHNILNQGISLGLSGWWPHVYSCPGYRVRQEEVVLTPSYLRLEPTGKVLVPALFIE